MCKTGTEKTKRCPALSYSIMVMLYYDLVALYFILILLQPSKFEDVTKRGRLELFDKGMIDGFSILYRRLRGERKNPSGTTAHLSLLFFF